jgi:UV DNA damage repair endonuclease
VLALRPVCPPLPRVVHIASTVAPLSGQHAEYIDATEFAEYLSSVPELPFAIMLEVKAKDLAVLKLREDLQTVAAPHMAVPQPN